MDIWLAILQVLTLAVVLTALYRPLGDYMATINTSTHDLRIERGFYRLVGVDSRSEQTWQSYLRGVLAFSAVGVLFVYALQRAQAVLPYSSAFRRSRRVSRSTLRCRLSRTRTGSPIHRT